MTARVLCPALDAMLRKTIIALCEVNVQYNLCLEISGSLHIRADGERVFNCLIEEELNGKEKKMRKDSLNDIAGFSIDLAKLHRDSMDSFTEREDEFEGDELELEDEATLADGAAQSEALEVSSASSSQYSKSPASADVAPCGGAGSDLDHVPSTSAVGCGIPTMHPSQAKSNLATIFPTPKIEPNTNTSAAQNTFLMSTPTTCNNPTSDGTAPQNSLVNSTACNLAAVASANPNLNLQAVAIAAAIQRAAEASKKNIGMVLPTQNAATATNSASASTSMMETNQPPAQEPMPQVTVKQEEPTEGDSSLTPIGLNFQLALFQNQMAQIQMMQAANASAMLNMGSNVGLNSLGTAAGLNTSNLTAGAGLSPGLAGLAALGAVSGAVPAAPPSAPTAESPPAPVPPAPTPPTASTSSKSPPVNVGNPVRTNTGAKKWQCGFCGILVSSKFYLSSHINAVHTRTRIYPCDICGRLFYSHGAQRIHKLRYHWVDKRHKCPQCSQMFVLPVELRQHIQRKHKHTLM